MFKLDVTRSCEKPLKFLLIALKIAYEKVFFLAKTFFRGARNFSGEEEFDL